MIREDVATFAPPRDMALVGPPNWTAIVFFAVLSGLHFAVSLPAFYHARWEGYLSFLLAIIFMAASVFSYFFRHSMTVSAARRTILLSTGYGPLRFTRQIPFTDVHAVRLTLSRSGKSSESCIQILCDNEDLECPATTIPRQQALFLAMTMRVQLIKATDDESAEETDRAF